MRRIRRMVSALLGAVAATIAIVAFIVVVLAVLSGLAVVVAVVAYLKRAKWTKPAYRWARATSGRWNVTPWTPTGKTVS